MKIKENIVSTPMATKNGAFNTWVWNGERGQESLALSTQTLDPSKEVLVRIHSECITGDVFGSLACDCGEQKDEALRVISNHGNGIFIYHRQEGRNMGLFKKIQAYNLMLDGFDTHEANIQLSGNPDAREYSDVLKVLSKLLNGHKSSIVLLSNNPHKKLVLEREGYDIKNKPLDVGETFHNKKYIQTKKEKFLHYTSTFNPYVGITLFQNDLSQKGAEIAKAIRTLNIPKNSRKIFIGVPIHSFDGDLKNLELIKKINSFAKHFKDIEQVSIVLHMDYSERRKFYRELKSFLIQLNFRYSLQLRFQKGFVPRKVDIDIIDSFQSEHIIFQTKREQQILFKDEKFIEYLRLNKVYVQLDESFGTGRVENLEIIQKNILDVVNIGVSHISVAGGYDNKKVKEIIELEDYFKIPISVDAESNLRKQNKLNIVELVTYLGFFFRSQEKCGR